MVGILSHNYLITYYNYLLCKYKLIIIQIIRVDIIEVFIICLTI